MGYAFVYSQSTGLMYIEDYDGNRAVVGRGYSGHGRYKNDPNAEGCVGLGPIPKGVWKIHDPVSHRKLGPIAMYLEPIGHAAHNRSEFFIHGDSTKKPGEASQGCIILGPTTRKLIANSGINVLDVID